MISFIKTRLSWVNMWLCSSAGDTWVKLLALILAAAVERFLAAFPGMRWLSWASFLGPGDSANLCSPCSALHRLGKALEAGETMQWGSYITHTNTHTQSGGGGPQLQPPPLLGENGRTEREQRWGRARPGLFHRWQTRERDVVLHSPRIFHPI